MLKDKELQLEKRCQVVEEQKELLERDEEDTGPRLVLNELLNYCYKYLYIPVIALSLYSINCF